MTDKFQQGGSTRQQDEDVQKQVIAMVQAAMQGDQKAQTQIQQIVQAAQQGDQRAVQLAQLIQQVIKQMQGQARRASYGAKLDYIHRLRTGVGRDEEVVYEKCGGRVTGKTVRKKCAGARIEDGGTVEPLKKKVYFGGSAKGKKCYFGGSL